MVCLGGCASAGIALSEGSGAEGEPCFLFFFFLDWLSTCGGEARGVAGVRGGSFSLWDVWRIKSVRNFRHIFQAAVPNTLAWKFSNTACCTLAFAIRPDGAQSNSVGMKPLAIDSSLCCTVIHFLHTLYNQQQATRK